jgi:hypothetical protein
VSFNLPPPYEPQPAESQRLSHSQEAQARALEGIATFAVRATVMPRRRSARPSHHRGVLMISADEIVFATRDPSGTRRFAHADRSITMTKARLRPPWSNTYLLLQDKKSAVRVAAPFVARRALRSAVRESGVKLIERSSWGAPQNPGPGRKA